LTLDKNGNEKKAYKMIEDGNDRVELGVVYRYILKLCGEYIDLIPLSKAKFSVMREAHKTKAIRGKHIAKISSGDIVQDVSLSIYEAIIKGETSLEGLDALAFKVAQGSFLNRLEAEKKTESLGEFSDLYMDNVTNTGRELPMFEAKYVQDMREENELTSFA
jgi:hypothetical protein